MKKCILIIIIVLLITNCKKEDPVLTGDLKITFTYSSNITNNEISVYIYFAENTNAALYFSVEPDLNGNLIIKDLNPGNYILEFNFPGGGLTRGFQITAGKQTELTYNLD
jgi:hypothetical protein